MKSSTKLLGTMILVVLLFTGMLFGQSLEERLQSMVAKNAEMYMNPLATAFGSGMNSGWFHSAKPHKLLGFDFGVRAMAVTFPDDQKMFNFDISQLEDYDFSTTITVLSQNYSIEMTAADLYPNTEVPTVLGKNKAVDVRASKDQLVQIITDQLTAQGADANVISEAGTLIDDAADDALNVVPPMEIKGTGLDFVPLVVPQAAVGLSLPMLPIKAEIVVRGLPEVEVSEELGSFQFFGGGAKLALDPFIPVPMFPVNIAVGAYTQKMTLGSVFEANNTLMSLMVGKDLNLMSLGLGVYGAVGLESSNIKIKYDLELPDGTVSPVRFDMKGDNKFRTTIGGRIRLAVININADYSVGADNVFTVGAGISIR
ncbi:MAG: hypothetical protein DRP96_10380 [Candidatus Neomarinimicrobiota bacterium]|nr:MAG: hypothetical protein DRP96_10380 [Candidatus Neomarinimicrobiota bacterium]